MATLRAAAPPVDDEARLASGDPDVWLDESERARCDAMVGALLGDDLAAREAALVELSAAGGSVLDTIGPPDDADVDELAAPSAETVAWLRREVRVVLARVRRHAALRQWAAREGVKVVDGYARFGELA